MNWKGFLILIVGAALALMFLAPPGDTVGSADQRLEFPGRRQGGGTHWLAPPPTGLIPDC